MTDKKMQEQESLARRAVERGLVTPEQAQECMAALRESAGRGEPRPLGDILVEKGYLTEVQMRNLQEVGDTVAMICPKCGEKRTVLRKWASRARCPNCDVDLVPADKGGIIEELEVVEDETADSLIGREFGGCKVLEKIGHGAMGAVYKGLHVGLNRHVALKVISMSGRSQEIVKRLLFEARAVARLEHPNIVQVHDVGFQKNYFFLVMQLLQGRTLTAVLEKRKALSVQDAVKIVASVARGLDAAHSAGIVHRDVKPDNVILGDDGRVRITDFGLAQDTTKARKGEQERIIVGTPYYMSPEQWLGHRARETSDLYSLGVVFYEMLAGRRPFEDERVGDLMHKHLKVVAKPVHKANEKVPETLSVIVKKMMAKAPKRRYTNMKEFLKDLERFRKGETPDAMSQFGRVVRCTFCDTLNPVGETKCSVCKEPLGGDQELTLKLHDDEFECPKCREPIKKGMTACTRCGTKFCMKCRAKPAVNRGYCEGCATEAVSAAKRKKKR